MKKKYIVIRLFRGYYVETIGTPQTKKEAESRCAKLNEKAGELTEYEVRSIGSTKKSIKLI